MVKRYMVPMFALVTAETESASEAIVSELQTVALKHGFSLMQDELLSPKSFDDEKDEIHSVLDLVPHAELTNPYQIPSPIDSQQAMEQRSENRPIADDIKIFLKNLGYDIREDSQQPGLWIWDGCDISFGTEKEALDSAWVDAVSQTMGINNLSSEQWDAIGFEEQKAAVMRALADDDVVTELPRG